MLQRTSAKILSLTLLLLAVGNAQAINKVYEYELKNGMKVLIQPDTRAPVVVSQVWYKVGSSSESSGITGVSHVLEHMMFKGTEAYPAGRFSAIIAENGGQENAFTGKDYTAYYQFLGKDRLEIAFKLEADRMRNLTLPKEEFAKEVEVVKEERLMRTEDNPEALTYERFQAVASLNGPYHHPVIGWMEDLNSLDVEDLKGWYDSWYQPNNATLVVVGDVDPDATFALAQTYFGAFKAVDIPALKPRKETRQRGERRVFIHAPAKVPYLIIGYPAPVYRTAEVAWEPFALDVLAGILDGGASSRLSSELVRKDEIASSASAGYSMTGMYQSLFMLDGTPTEAHTVKELEAALEAQVEKLRTTLVSQAELDRIKAQVIASEVYQRDSVRHQANQIGVMETVGIGWKFLDEYAKKIQAITAEQVQEVAKKYLVDAHKTVAELIPEDIDKDHKEKPDA